MLIDSSVVESVTSAYRFELNSREIMNLTNLTASMSGGQPAVHDLAVIVNITKRANWWVTLPKGSWTRVITNLVGKLRNGLQLSVNIWSEEEKRSRF